MGKYSQLDPGQIARNIYDEDQNAQRVVMIGDFGIGEAIKEQLKDLKVSVDMPQQREAKEIQVVEVEKILKELQLERIEIPVIVKEIEIREIEKQVIVDKYHTITIEKPVIVEKTNVVTVDRPIIVKEQEKFPELIKYLLILQTLSLMALTVSSFIKR